MSSLKEAFEEFDELDDIYYDIDNKQDIEKLKNVLDNEEEDDLDNLEMIVDVDAEDEEELKDSYVGELLLYCPSCHTIHYAKKEDIIEDEENPEIVNVGEQCPHCDAIEGFEIVGEVAPYNDAEEDNEIETENEYEDEFDLTAEDDLEDEQNFEENLKSGKQKSILERLLEDDFSQSNIDKDGKPLELEGDDDTIEEKVGSVLPKVKKQVKEHKTTKTTKKSLKESKLVEKPLYDLKPRYDARQSFYNKATVDTGDDGKQNKLYSYNTLVAEIKDGKPVVYGTYSQTTLRHIKDWLLQNGFKAENKAQIEKDYMTEGCGKKNLKEEVQDEAYAIADYVYEKIKDKDLVEWDEFEDLVNEATKELYGVDLYNDFDMETDKVIINDKEFDVNDLVNGDIRGILGYEGYATIYEGEHEGGLTTKEIEESLKESKSLKEGYQDVMTDILERAKMNVDEGYAVDEAIFDAIDNGLIYTNNQFDVLKSLFNLDDLYTSNGENAAQLVDEHIFNEIYNEVSDYFNEKNGEVEESLKEGKIKIKDEIQRLVDKYSKLQKQYHGDSSASKNVEAEIDRLQCLLDKGKEYIEESLKKEHRTVDQIKESIKSKLNKVLKENVSKEDDIDAKDDDKKEVAKEKEEKAIDDADADKDYEEDEIDESLFDNLINKYCTRVYENVKDYKTTNGYLQEGKMILEGLLTYKSGKTTNTRFIFEKKMIKDNKVKYVGLNETFSKSKKAFALNCKVDNKKIISESLTYNYKVKVDDSKKVVYGSIKNN